MCRCSICNAQYLVNKYICDDLVLSITHCAGADIATTCSYQASFQGFEQAGIGRQDAEHLLRRSIRLADSARTQYLQAEEAKSCPGAWNHTPYWRQQMRQSQAV